MDVKLRFDIGNRVTTELYDIIKRSETIAAQFGVGYVGTEFFILGMLRSTTESAVILNKYGVTEKKYSDAIKADLTDYNVSGYTTNTISVLNKSAEVADSYNCGFIATEHLLLAVLRSSCMGNALIRKVSPYYSDLVGGVENLLAVMSERLRAQGIIKMPDERKYKPYLEDDTGNEPPSIEGTVLSKFGYDMTEKARRGRLDPVIGRNAEMDRIINTLSRRQKNNPLVIGEPGTGKSAVVEGLARRIASGDVPITLKNKILYSLDLSSVVAGAKMRGEFEQRFKEIVDYIRESGNVILFIDEIHNLVAGAKSDGVDASEILKPALARGDIQMIGATTVSEYRKYIEKDPALERRFQPIMIEPPSVEDSIEIIKGLKNNFEAHHLVEITSSAIEAAARLSDRYITDRFLPDKAIDLIDEAAARARILADHPDKELIEKEREIKKIRQEIDYMRSAGKEYGVLYAKLKKLSSELDELNERLEKQRLKNHPYIDADDVAKVISELTGIPVSRLTEEEKKKLSGLEDALKKRVIGQDNAVIAVSHAIRRAMTGIKDPEKPIGTFLFVGPTGVGKTELTKALAETVFGDEDMLIRIDMSEFMEPNSIAKLIGAPPGYVGYEDEGQLTEKVRRHPYSVILFDEIEKAHADVFNLFLQMFDDGRLTDSKGRLVDFKNTIIIMTSNVGAEALSNSHEGYVTETAREKMQAALKRRFKPEFLNRIDDIVTFKKLSKDDCRPISVILLDRLVKKLALLDVKFTYDPSIVDLILNEGYSEEYGARPLKRTVSEILEDAVSEKIIEGGIRQGDKVRAVTDENGFLDFVVMR